MDDPPTVNQLLARIRDIPPPLVVTRDGIPITNIDKAPASADVARNKIYKMIQTYPALDKAMPGYNKLVRRAWEKMSVQTDTSSSTTFLRREVDGKSGGGTIICGLQTYGVALQIPHAKQYPPELLVGVLSSDELSQWLVAVSTGTAGALDNPEWRVGVEFSNDDHWDVGNVDDTVNGVVLDVTSKRTGASSAITLWIGMHMQQPVLYDVELDTLSSGKLTHLAACVDAVLGGVQKCLLRGDWRPATATVIYNCDKASVMMKRQGWGSGADTHHAFGDKTAPPEAVQGQLIDVAHYNLRTGVHHGRIAAGDVPPALQVVSGINGGKDITMCTLTIHVGNRIAHQTLTVCSHINSISYLHNAVKHAPCVRDGLLAAGLIAGLEGDTHGSIVLRTTNGSLFQAKTVWNMAAADPDTCATVTTRDIVSTYRGLISIALMQRWKVTSDDSTLTINAVSREHGAMSVRVTRGPSTLARWAELLSVEEELEPWSPTSELGLDYWLSGIARYLLRDYIKRGRVTLNEQLCVSDDNVFASMKHIKPSAARAKPCIDLVVDLEMLNKTVDGAGMTYVYAIGIARIEDGQVTKSTLVVDDSPDLMTMIQQGNLNQKHKDNATKLLSLDTQVGNPGDVLDRVRTVMEQNPNVRLYGKGVDHDDAVLQGVHNIDTRLFRRQRLHPNSRKLRELGSLIHKVEDIAKSVGWPGDHNPAVECVLFAYASGMAEVLPAVSTVGTNSVDDILSV